MNRQTRKQVASFKELGDRLQSEAEQRKYLLRSSDLLKKEVEDRLASKLLELGVVLQPVHLHQLRVRFTPPQIDPVSRRGRVRQLYAQIKQVVESTLSGIQVDGLTLKVSSTQLQTNPKPDYEVVLSLEVFANGSLVHKKASYKVAGTQKSLEWCFKEAFPRNDMRAIADCLSKVKPSNLTVKRFDNDIDLVKGNDSVCYFHATINGTVLMESLLKRVSSDPVEAAAWLAKTFDKYRAPTLYGRPLSRVARKVLRAHLRRRK